ncbi:L,D-transpeptidase family protein [Lichenihabitans psoromatis]|uniref:L,D-transpeptidase family protein n=1 Tax=Lichenihabitans psoromatis TaxID=2528642 RepID=UPI0010355644|nr:L,D-transpeptidase [Lichenihabitans psoromatis]
MRRQASAASLLFCLTLVSTTALAAVSEKAATVSLDSVNAATFSPLSDKPSVRPVPEVVKAEVLLDRARFSPGAIDGIDGDNFRKAIAAYQAQMKLPVSGHLDQATWNKLVGDDAAPVLTERPISAAEAKGPFVKRIPAKMEQQSKLDRMGYRNIAEMLSEEVHVSPSLLKALNPHDTLEAGVKIVVPQVVVQRGAPAKVARIVVDKADHAVRAFAADGALLAFYPASIGSEEKPAPSGQFSVVHVTHNPDYTYNPKYAFKGVKSTKPFRIAPGPNNPVGSVWIDLSDEGYGIHGTPEPDLVGKTQSHGCIRLTNWDVEDLASMVGKGVPVDFEDQAQPAVTTDKPIAAAAPAASVKP